MLIKAKGNPTQRNSDGEIMSIGVPYEEDDAAANSLIEIDAVEVAVEVAPEVVIASPVVTTSPVATTTQKASPAKVTGEG